MSKQVEEVEKDWIIYTFMSNMISNSNSFVMRVKDEEERSIENLSQIT